MAEQRTGMADRPEQRWARRLLPAVLVAAVLWWVAGLVGVHSRLAVDLGLALLVAAVLGLTKDTGPAWTVSMPTAADRVQPHFPVQDARLSFLRRAIRDTTSRQHPTGAGRAYPAGLQRSLRTIAAHRAGRRSGLVLDPEDRAVLADHLDPVLAQYLCPTTPPPIDEAQLSDLIRRIEKL